MNHSVSPQRLSPGDADSPSWLSGCLIAAVLVALLIGGGGLWLYFNGKAIVASVARAAAVEMIDEMEVPPEEKDELMTEVDRIHQGFANGQIGFEELGELIGALEKSPISTIIIGVVAESRYIEGSGLDEEEKVAAHRTLQRVARGLMDRQISKEDLEPVLDPITVERNGENGQKLKQKLTDEEVRALLGRAKAVADGAGVPEEPVAVKLGAELRRIVDETLGRELADPAEPSSS